MYNVIQCFNMFRPYDGLINTCNSGANKHVVVTARILLNVYVSASKLSSIKIKFLIY